MRKCGEHVPYTSVVCPARANKGAQIRLELQIRGPPTRAGRTREGESAENQKRCTNVLQNWPRDKVGHAAVPKEPYNNK